MRNTTYYLHKIIDSTIVQQLSWYTSGQIIVQLFSFLGVIVTSRYLGPTNVGLYSFVQNYLATFMTIIVGMDFYFTWKVAKSDRKIQDLTEYFGHKLNVAFLLTIIGIALAWILLPKDVALMATIMFVPLLLTSCTAFFQYAVATNNARIIATLQALSSIFLFILKMILVATKASLVWFVVVNATDIVLVGTLLAAVYLSKENIRLLFKQTAFPSLWKTVHFVYAIRMSLLAIALWQLILRVDQLVLATFSNAYALGIYAAAVKIAEVPNFLAGVLYTALVTHIAFFAGKEDDLSKRKVRRVLFLYAIGGVMIAFIIILIAPVAISFLYGQKFISAVPVLRAYALSIPGMFVTLHYFGIYGAKDRHFFQSTIFALALLLNIALVYILTPLFGLMGASYATAISYTLVAVIFYFHVR